jgi:hypothetical protein
VGRNDIGGSKRTKIQSPKISAKMVLSRRAHRELSNGANNTSNGVRTKKIWPIEVEVNPVKINLLALASV